MRLWAGVLLGACAAWPLFVSAQPEGWTTYSIPETCTSVDMPSSIYTEKAGQPDGHGQRFEAADGRAHLTIQSVPNTGNESPAGFLAKRHPPAHIRYQRITPHFFAVSSYTGDRIWYDRCNFSRRWIHCVLINYPGSEKSDWDRIVTRISLSLRGD